MVSKCECGNNSFEIVENTPKDSYYKLNFVQCRKCKKVIGVLDYYNIGFLINKQNKAIIKIARKLGVSVDI